MELHKLTAEEIRSWDADRFAEASSEIKKSLADVRMDIFSAKSQSAAKVNGLKKSLARMATIQNEIKRKTNQDKKS